MSDYGYLYEKQAGDWGIEGFAFRLSGPHGQLELNPTRLLGPPARDQALNTWVEIQVEVLGRPSGSEHFQVGISTLPVPASVLGGLSHDIDLLISGARDSVVFPSAESIGFESTCLECTIARDRRSTRGLSLLLRIATPHWWSGDAPPQPEDSEYHRFGASLSIIMEVEMESLDKMRLDIRRFLFALEQYSA